jgi:hypothetical protein
MKNSEKFAFVCNNYTAVSTVCVHVKISLTVNVTEYRDWKAFGGVCGAVVFGSGLVIYTEIIYI